MIRKGCGGHSMIFDPSGQPIVQALPEEEEGILVADINLNDSVGSAMMLDLVGHSARPDLLGLRVSQPQDMVMRD